MKKLIIKCYYKLKNSITKMRLCDRYLLLLMIILIFELTHDLFAYNPEVKLNSPVDTMIRTNASTVFGYFIGGGFLGNKCKNCDTENVDEKQKNRKNQQIKLVSTIGIFSLIILIIINNCKVLPTPASSTVSQFRDFVSGSVGLLIGYCSNYK